MNRIGQVDKSQKFKVKLALALPSSHHGTMLPCGPQVGAIGFCMGGALTLAAAERCGIDCGVAFYGLPVEAICTVENIKVPVALHFGRLDEYKGFSDADVSKGNAEAHNGQAMPV